MHNILAQAGEIVISAVGGGVVLWVGQKILRHGADKMLNHPDDDARHIAPGDTYVDIKLCDTRFKNLVGHIQSVHEDVREIRKKVDEKL